MTPLPRWVFLALLLDGGFSFTAHRVQDACVPICRAQKSSAETAAGDCEYESPVLQFRGDHPATRQHLRRCLIPCNGPVAPGDPPTFNDSNLCRTLRGMLLLRRSCSCDSLEEDQALGAWEDYSWVDKISKDLIMQDFHAADHVDSELALMLRSALRATLRSKDPVTLKLDGLPTGRIFGAEAARGLQEEDPLESVTAVLNAESTVDPDSSEEYPVDWERWCMAQCNNGQGGNACNCDIIP